MPSKNVNPANKKIENRPSGSEMEVVRFESLESDQEDFEQRTKVIELQNALRAGEESGLADPGVFERLEKLIRARAARAKNERTMEAK
jgi:hypothetical protein